MPSCPIGALPTELLIEIFAFCAKNAALAPLIVGQVCTFWRDVVTRAPHVWQTILLDDSKSIVSAQEQAQRWIAHSSPLAFDVELSLAKADNMFPLLAACLPHLRRWRKITMTGQREESVVLSDLNIHSLEHLFISLGTDYEGATEYQPYQPKSTFVEYSPLWPGVMAMDVWMSALPTPQTLPALQFTTICIVEQAMDVRIPSSSVLNLLKACPTLRTFSFSGSIHREDSSSTVVSLPELTSLTLKSTSLTRAILSSIDAPKLDELYLAMLNVDVDLASSTPYEDGDSDDEHNDFSLSPTSDRATGMGLRRIISHCNPPIRILEMNYSDMRTKDFIHIFNRVKTIQDFIIVASDMSNTVIKLFSHCLPAMKRLELYNCHRFDGDVLVDALRRRSVFDQPIQEMVVSGCDGFTPAHGQILRKDLGSRFMED